MADVGGLIKTLFMMAQFMYMFYNTNAYFDNIINFDAQGDQIERKILSTIKIPETDKYSINLTSKVALRPIKFSVNNELNQYKSSPRFVVKWYEALLCYLTIETVRRHQINQAISTMKEKLGIETYLKLVWEFEKLKNINKITA